MFAQHFHHKNSLFRIWQWNQTHKIKIVDTKVFMQLALLPMSTSATRPMVTPKKLICFCPFSSSTSKRSRGRLLSSAAPTATLVPAQVAPKLLIPSRGWWSWRNNEQHSAFPEPPGTIPTGMLQTSSQSSRYTHEYVMYISLLVFLLTILSSYF